MIRKRTYEIIEKSSPDDIPGRIVDVFIVTLIILNVTAVILETIPELASLYGELFQYFELFSVVIFSIEYLLRLWSCTSDDRYSRSIMGRIKFILTPMAVIDLLAIAPFFLPMIVPVDLRFLRAFRLFRLFRMFKLARYSKSLQTLGNVMRRSKEELLITLFALFVLLMIVSGLMFYVERDAQPEAFSSIPAAMWWGIVTLTTVGYGDVYPITPVGKLLAALIALLGIGLFALPAGILGSGFVSEIEDRKEKRKICPHCGKELDEPLDE
ncbi:MAG: ion transporter [Candidatus Electryoneaceae bacterium]|nr:ion transporter [Candidatus Electryoneaceae bacterium]